MKKRLVLISLGLLLVIMVGLWRINGNPTTDAENSQPVVADFADEPTFWVLSDPHFIAPELYDDGAAFEKIKKTTAGKEVTYQEASWQTFIQQAKKEEPDGVIITGDLTFNGEKRSAEQLAVFFAELEAVGIPVFALPGNHDIHNSMARKYQKDEQIKIDQISAEEFKQIFSDSYAYAADIDERSLSYSLNVNKEYQFIFLDTNIYTLEPGKGGPVTAGKLKPDTLKWLEKCLASGKENHQTRIVFMHHNLFSHNKLVNKGFVLNNADKLLPLLEKYQVPIVFSGHIHAQDILEGPNSKIKEIVTGSFSISPQVIGELKLGESTIDYQKKTLDTSQIVMKDNEAESYESYLKELFIEDGKRMAYGELINQEIYDEEILDPIADFVGQVNWTFFSGNDFITDEEVVELKKQTGYQLLEKNSTFLKEYIDSIIQDTNLNDNQLSVKRSNK